MTVAGGPTGPPSGPGSPPWWGCRQGRRGGWRLGPWPPGRRRRSSSWRSRRPWARARSNSRRTKGSRHAWTLGQDLGGQRGRPRRPAPSSSIQRPAVAGPDDSRSWRAASSSDERVSATALAHSSLSPFTDGALRPVQQPLGGARVGLGRGGDGLGLGRGDLPGLDRSTDRATPARSSATCSARPIHPHSVIPPTLRRSCDGERPGFLATTWSTAWARTDWPDTLGWTPQPPGGVCNWVSSPAVHVWPPEWSAAFWKAPYPSATCTS